MDRRLSQRIIDGNRNGLEADLTEALESGTAALAIVNDILLEGMKVVGERFASGEMQLPFVLQSAETMKAAVAFLEPHMEKSDQGGKGTVVLATVKGDVHDIGKNLVDIILTNNGYEVVNLGIKIGINEMVSAVEEHKADAIGMSGLLVKSTLIMRENLVELNDRSLSNIPVLLGGAALTRTYVERDLREVYDGRLFYGRDAFEGLRTMDRLVELKKNGEDDPLFGREISEKNVPRRSRLDAQDTTPVEGQPARADVASDNPLFTPPFVGSRVAVGIPIDDVAEYLNLTALFRNQWGFRPENGENDTEFKDRVKATLREQLGKAKEADLLVPSVAYGHFAANAEGNDLVIWKDESRSSEWMRFAVPAAAQGALAVHLGLLPPDGLRRRGLRQLHALHHRGPGLGGDGAAVRREPLPGVPLPARPQRRDGRGHGRVLAPPDPRGARVRRRGRPDPDRAVPPAVPGRPLLVGLPGLSRPDRQRQGRGAAGRGPHRRHRERGVPAQPRADDRRHHLPPPRGQVLRRVMTTRARRWARLVERAAALIGVRPSRGGGGAGGACCPPAPTLRRPRGRRRTLGTVVIPNVALGYAVTSQGPLDAVAVRLRRAESVGRRRGAVHAGQVHLDLRAGVAGRRRPQPGAGPAGPLPRTGRGRRCSCRPPSTRWRRARS